MCIRDSAGVIKEIALRPLQSSDKLMQLLLEIKRFSDENQYNMGKVDLFSQDSREDVNAVAVRHLLSFMKFLLDDPGRRRLALADTFKLEFRVKENDNDLSLIHIYKGRWLPMHEYGLYRPMREAGRGNLPTG